MDPTQTTIIELLREVHLLPLREIERLNLRITELEPLSPEARLAPGQNVSFAELWRLIPLDREVTTADQARKLVKLIGPSPFAARK